MNKILQFGLVCAASIGIGLASFAADPTGGFAYGGTPKVKYFFGTNILQNYTNTATICAAGQSNINAVIQVDTSGSWISFGATYCGTNTQTGTNLCAIFSWSMDGGTWSTNSPTAIYFPAHGSATQQLLVVQTYTNYLFPTTIPRGAKYCRLDKLTNSSPADGALLYTFYVTNIFIATP